MSDTPETVDVRAVPTFKGLRHYLDYQYPPTRGDVLLNKFCNEIAELERERNEARNQLKELIDENAEHVANVVKEQQRAEKAVDIVDMQRDEFKRIRALCHQTGVRGQELQGICDRAIACIEQTIPVIIQRDGAEAERDQLRKVADELAKQLDRLHAENECFVQCAAKLALRDYNSLPHVKARNEIS